jgi:hypothetical protein
MVIQERPPAKGQSPWLEGMNHFHGGHARLAEFA